MRSASLEGSVEGHQGFPNEVPSDRPLNLN